MAKLPKRRTVLILVACVLVGLCGFVCYAQRPTGATYGVTIHAPPDEVYAYMSDNSHARDWSIFFDHISDLPGPPAGTVGSHRRCFRRADETGASWDEDTVSVDPPRSRRIRTYNLQHFKGNVLKDASLYVVQGYASSAPGTTVLSFTGGLEGGDLLQRVYAFFLAGESERVFRLNLENIKAAIEQKGQFVRPHPWEASSVADE